MRILLDENMPESVAASLRALGHTVDSVNSLRLKGVADVELLGHASGIYDLLFTKDVEFAERFKERGRVAGPKVVRVTIPQARASVYTAVFLAAFRESDWQSHGSGEGWP